MRYALTERDYIQFEVHDGIHGFGIYAYNMHNFYVRLLTEAVAESMHVTLPDGYGYRHMYRTKEAAERTLAVTAQYNGWEEVGKIGEGE